MFREAHSILLLTCLFSATVAAGRLPMIMLSDSVSGPGSESTVTDSAIPARGADLVYDRAVMVGIMLA